MSEKNTLVLASNSPRRRQLLSLGGWAFSISVADIDESQLPDELPSEYVLRLAKAKAHKSAENASRESVVIAADTTVVEGDEILGKPVDEMDAVRMLERLRGHTHQVYTGLALLEMSDNRLLTDLSVTNVLMRHYSDEEIDAYVHTGDPLDKAGAYAIQHASFHPVQNLEGCFASVMGLPLCRLTYLLEKFDVHPETDIGVRCQTELQYKCPISNAILRETLVS